MHLCMYVNSIPHVCLRNFCARMYMYECMHTVYSYMHVCILLVCNLYTCMHEFMHAARMQV